MSIFDAWYRAVTRRSPSGETRDVRRQMADLERIHDSSAAAARAVGVNKGTWWRWKTGRSAPKAQNVERVRIARRQALVPERRQAAVSRSTGQAKGGLTITGWITVSRDSRHRTINLGPYLGVGRLNAAMTSFLRGDDPAAEAEFQAVLADYIGQDVNVEGATITF